MKQTILILSFLSFVLAARSQTYHTVSHLSGTQTISGNSVSVTSIGATSTTYCGIGPYWIGAGGKNTAYMYSFSFPVKVIRVIITAVNNGEIMSIYANGTKYTLTNANLSNYTGNCSAGTCFISSGDVTANTTSIGSNAAANCQLDVVLPTAADSIRVQHANGVGAGSTYSFQFASDTLVTIKKPFHDTLLCAGDTVKIPYEVTWSFNSTNTFTAQLSDASGSFASPTTIGTINSATAGVFTWVVPATITTGAGYRIRIVGSSPSRISADNGIDIGIGKTPITNLVAGNNGPVCTNDTLKLYASTPTSGVTYSWTGPNSFSSTLQNPKIAPLSSANHGDYIVTARLYGCVAKDTTTAIIISGSGATGVLASSNSPVCIGGDLQLTSTATGSSLTYSWTGPNSFTSNQQNPTIPAITAAASGDYILYVSNGQCTSRDTITVSLKPIPENFSSSYNAPVCAGETLQFTSSSSTAGVTYGWTGPNSFSSGSSSPFINGATAVHDGDYYVTADLNGCSLVDTVSVTIKPVPAQPSAGSNSAICAGETLALTSTSGTAGVTYSWTGPASFTSSVQNPTIANATTSMSGNYIVTADLNGCARSNNVTVTVKPLPAAVSATNSGPACAGDTLHISIGASTTGTTYSWTGPNSFTAAARNAYLANSNTAASGWYVATLTLNGCVYKDSTNATVNPIPAAPTPAYNNPLCITETLKLSANTINNATYTWTGPNSFSSALQSPTRANIQFGDTGTYSATITVNGCTSPGVDISVKANPVPFVVILPSPGDTICTGSPATFTALPNNHGGAPSYLWYVNGISQGVNSTVFSTSSLNDKDVVRCDMTEYSMCDANYVDESNDVEMNVLPWLAPSVSITANPTTPLKPDEYVKFTAITTDAGANPEYQWHRNGVDVVGAKGATWSANTLNDNDEVSVEVTSSYKCPQPPSATSNRITIKVLTHVENDYLSNAIRIYPNPAGAFVVFEYLIDQQPHMLKLNIVNSLGQDVLSRDLDINSGRFVWATHDIAPGVYVYRIMANESTVSAGRIVITH